MINPTDLLAATHRGRTRDRTAVGMWLADLSPEERERFRQFVRAFRDNPTYRMPVLVEALRADEILGEAGAGFPDATGESIKKFLKRYDAENPD